MNMSAGECIRLSSVRSIVPQNVCAVTGASEGGENRKPSRIWNVYVMPSGETFGKAEATSGANRRPAAPDASG
jgi:hypothetical protein